MDKQTIARSIAQIEQWREQGEQKDREIEKMRGVLIELRQRLHTRGRRPEECYEMSLIDEALKP